MKIQGSISLITGGCQGFGRAFSKELLKRGGKVSVVDINETIGQKVSTEFKDQYGNENVHFIQCDVTDSPSLEGAFKETISKFGRLDILCNNAGAVMHSWKKLVELNLTSVIHGTFLGVKHMKASNNGEGGLIVNMGSLSGLFPYRDAPVYSATKFGVVGFSQSLRKANVKDKIRVNCLCPSFSPTTMVEKGLAARPEMRPFVEKIGIVPIEDVAKGFLELVNDDSRDGEVLSVTVQGMAYVTARHDIVPVEPKL
eukprot:Seg1653.11 transcript_id=Seg1653.11/GoldUCD/mRNA.D3Y31 product="15-hydroxyprostaglandin dehydrogenase" protein_id=Seg1653.11/GoldUCD/D3Y31